MKQGPQYSNDLHGGWSEECAEESLPAKGEAPFLVEMRSEFVLVEVEEKNRREDDE